MTVIRVCDLETTGTPSETVKHAIVEIGWVDVVVGDDGVTEIRGPYSRLTNPRRPIPPDAMGAHHITDAMVADAPPVDRAILEMMETRPDYFCAHYADFEQHFIGANIPWLCTYKIALRYWPEAPDHKLQTLRYLLQLNVDEDKAHPPHRAGPDAYVGAHLIMKILRENRQDIDTLVKWSKGPALLPIINFGKHRGQRWEEAPPDYLEWILDKSDLDRDTKANAKYHLKKRGLRL